MSRKFKMMDEKLRDTEINRYMKLTKLDLAILLTDTKYCFDTLVKHIQIPVSKTKIKNHGDKKPKTRRLLRSNNSK